MLWWIIPFSSYLFTLYLKEIQRWFSDIAFVCRGLNQDRCRETSGGVISKFLVNF